MAYSNGYTYRKKITVDATKVSGSGSLTDFPFLVSHTDAAIKTTANGGKVENSSGYDIRFETTGGVELDYERLLYVATTGQIIAWVQATIDGTTSTEIYMYYGNSSISTDQSDPTGTWDATYKGVWHMTEDPSLATDPSLVQSKIDNTNASVTFDSSTTSGNLVVVTVTKSTATAFAAGDVTDNKGNTFSMVRNQNGNGGTDQGAIFYAYNISGGASHQITYPGGGTIAIAEYSGILATEDPLDQENSGSGSSTTPDSGNITTTERQLIVGLAWSLQNGDTWTANNSFTLRQSETDNNTYERHALADKVGNAQTTSANFTVDTSASWLAVVASFRPAPIKDSTSNNYDMVTAGTMTSGDLITGQIYKAIDFDGTDDEAKNTAWASVIDENDAFTIEHWFNITTTPNSQMVAWGEAGASNLCSTGTFGNNIGYLGYANDHVVSAAPYDDGAWHHLAVTHDGATMKVLIDGSEVLSDSTTTGINASQDLFFARWKDGGFYPVKLEEVRISAGTRSNDWEITTYETAKNPSTFYSLGTEETSSATVNSNFFMFFN